MHARHVAGQAFLCFEFEWWYGNSKKILMPSYLLIVNSHFIWFFVIIFLKIDKLDLIN
jgi:hypothetical protein